MDIFTDAAVTQFCYALNKLTQTWMKHSKPKWFMAVLADQGRVITQRTYLRLAQTWVNTYLQKRTT